MRVPDICPFAGGINHRRFRYHGLPDDFFQFPFTVTASNICIVPFAGRKPFFVQHPADHMVLNRGVTGNNNVPDPITVFFFDVKFNLYASAR